MRDRVVSSFLSGVSPLSGARGGWGRCGGGSAHFYHLCANTAPCCRRQSSKGGVLALNDDGKAQRDFEWGFRKFLCFGRDRAENGSSASLNFLSAPHEKSRTQKWWKQIQLHSSAQFLSSETLYAVFNMLRRNDRFLFTQTSIKVTTVYI